jgi:predicted phage baseplate assembly protein
MTVREERLGVSNGRPVQSFTLRRKPVLILPGENVPDLDLTLTGADNLATAWTRVDDFYRSRPEDKHFTLDPITGTISFGDGRRGQIPVAGSRITVLRYRVGGGVVGNVAPGTITKIKGRVRGVKEATNPRPAHDGADAETLEEAKARAPHDLRSRDRAVSAEDFRDLALATPGVNLHKVYALARRGVDASGTIAEKDGSVTLVVLPRNDQDAPQPSEEQHRAICRWLEPRRLITTELHVIGPRYSDVTTLSARITVDDDFDLAAVTEAIYDRLLDFLHPISGGSDGTGWPFGGAIYHGDLYDQVLGVAGVRRVTRLRVALDGATPQTVDDFTVLAEGHLPVLRRDAISLVAGYA